jgi:hypothetical protein
MLDTWTHVTVPRTIVNAFREAVLVPYEESEVICLRVDRTAAQKVRHWSKTPHIEEGMGSAGKR